MKRGSKNEWERYLKETITDLSGFRIPHNKVLVEMDEHATDRSVGGILVVKDQDFAAHAIRWGKVKKLPERLYCQLKDAQSMPWECDIDLQEGDDICMVHMDSYQAYPFMHAGKYHRLVNYEGIVLARRNGRIIMCNGYVLLERVYKKLKAGAYEKEVDDPRWGIVKAIGKPNRRYKTYDTKYKCETLKEDSKIMLEPGDRVFIEDPQRVFDLEDWTHAVLEDRKVFKVCHRRRLGAAIPVG